MRLIRFSSDQTNSSGWIQRQEVTDYVNRAGVRDFYSNYTINASKTGYVTDNNIWNFTIQTNKMDDWFTLFTSTCIYVSGDWDINCSEGCIIDTNYDVGGNDISIIGEGNVVVSANITHYNKLHIEGIDQTKICRVTCIDGGCFKS